MSAIHVYSEIGPLRRVMIHRPGPEIDVMVPSMMEQLLFDDILWGQGARREHDRFRQVFESAGIEVVDAQSLLGKALESPEARQDLFQELAGEYRTPEEAMERLEGLSGEALAAVLVGGLRSEGDERERWSDRFFSFNPVPNYFFQRDPQVLVGNRVVISAMATDAREREPLLARIIFQHHPDYAGSVRLFEADLPDLPTKGTQFHAPTSPFPSLEGGDVLVASPETLLVGLSERTNRRGVERLAEHLRAEETPFRHLILVELPSQRSYMHLDTVFTLIDHGTCLAYLPVILSGSPESAYAYYVDLTAPELTFAMRPSLLTALEALDIELEVVPCGGGEDLIHQQREQWTDGANAFALAPGVILLYQRNRRTVEELDRRGWRVLTEEDVVDRGEHALGHGRTVITLTGHELSRARGGPRCMTAPLLREDL